MNRLLTQVRSRSLLFLSPTRSLSSIKSNSFDFKSHVLLNLVNQLDASKPKLSNVDLIYEHSSLLPLPGRVGFCHETKTISKFNPNRFGESLQEKEQLVRTQTKSSSYNNNNLEIRTYDCSLSLRSELQNLFLNYNTLTQPLTAITVIFKTNFDMSTWSIEVENERHQLTEQFIKLAHKISNYLNTKQYWVDFIDPSNGKSYYGPSTPDTLFETDERLRHFGINIVDLGTHVFIGCIFTNAPRMNSNVQHLLKEFTVPNGSKYNR